MWVKVFAILAALLGGQIGVATWYPVSQYGGQPLYCDAPALRVGQQVLRYDQATARTWGPWVALDVRAYQEGRVACGQEVLLYFNDGSSFRARALDAGPFDGHHVAAWPNVPILVDVPEYWSTENALILLVILPEADHANP